ncbi:MAG: glycosyltransferase [Anaerolineales bacterium]|nr:glycosyltransferase [Anaerolineales bacterium]
MVSDSQQLLNPANAPRKIKTIIFVIDGLGVGGAEHLMIPILGYLNKETFSARVCVLQSRDGNPLAEDIRSLGVQVDFLNVRHLRDFTALLRLRNYLKEVKADLIHTQLEFANILGNTSAKILGLPSVCTVHVQPIRDGRLKSRFHQWVEWMALRLFCDRIITVSEDTRRNYIAQSGISPKKLLTIYNGIDLTRFNRLKPDLDRASVREEFHLPKDSFLLTTVAVLRQQKGIEHMIRALPALHNMHGNVYYLIVGAGTYLAVLEKEAELTGLRENIIFAGSRKDIPRILSASDIFILPTLTEALPTVLAEAMACRLPIVASAVGGIPEMIQSNGNGCLVSPAQPSELSEACETLLKQPNLRIRMGDEGWNLVYQKFNIIHQVIQLEEQYLELINRYEQ